MGAATKTFDDAGGYESDIRAVVPGYDVLHALVPAMLAARLPSRARILVVGCGPGSELATIASVSPDWELDAIEPSEAMASEAMERVARARLASRVRVERHGLSEHPVDRPYDAVVCTLVSHFVPDDGSRAAFLRAMRAQLRPKGTALITDMVDDGIATHLLARANGHWARQRGGVPSSRIELLESRLESGFHRLTRARLRTIAMQEGFRVDGEFFRALGLVGAILIAETPT